MSSQRRYSGWALPPENSDAAIKSYVKQMKVSSAADLEALSQPASSSSDGPYAKPSGSCGPLRLKVKIEGLLDRSTILSPFGQQECVMYSAAATPEGDIK